MGPEYSIHSFHPSILPSFLPPSSLPERSQPSATVRGMALTLGEAFGEGFGWKHDVSDSCEIARKRVET